MRGEGPIYGCCSAQRVLQYRCYGELLKCSGDSGFGLVVQSLFNPSVDRRIQSVINYKNRQEYQPRQTTYVTVDKNEAVELVELINSQPVAPRDNSSDYVS